MLGRNSRNHELGFASNDVARLTVEAGQKTLGFYREETLEVREKDDRSPVTDADHAAHEAIMEGLGRLTPDIAVVSEESGQSEAIMLSTVNSGDPYWLVDPLDGTKDFLTQTDDFTINIALIVGGAPQLGFVYLPARRTLYAAWRGVGAYRWVDQGDPEEIQVRGMDPDRFVCMVSRHHQSGEAEKLHAQWPECTVEPAGSSLKYCRIAEGTADLSVRKGPTMLWDTAAAQCVLETAGGRLCDFKGQAFQYTDRQELKNPGFIAVGDPNVSIEPFIPT